MFSIQKLNQSRNKIQQACMWWISGMHLFYNFSVHRTVCIVSYTNVLYKLRSAEVLLQTEYHQSVYKKYFVPKHSNSVSFDQSTSFNYVSSITIWSRSISALLHWQTGNTDGTIQILFAIPLVASVPFRASLVPPPSDSTRIHH